MKEVLSDSLVEMFGTGTAAVVSPIGNIFFEGKMRQLPPIPHNSLSSRQVTYHGILKGTDFFLLGV